MKIGFRTRTGNNLSLYDAFSKKMYQFERLYRNAVTVKQRLRTAEYSLESLQTGEPSLSSLLSSAEDKLITSLSLLKETVETERGCIQARHVHSEKHK